MRRHLLTAWGTHYRPTITQNKIYFYFLSGEGRGTAQKMRKDSKQHQNRSERIRTTTTADRGPAPTSNRTNERFCRWLGVFGGILALLGVVAAPITSGDTALRSCRLIIADFVKLEQKTIRKRLYICIPLFAAVIALLIWQMSDKEGFGKIWSWFGWSNQTLSVFMLWAVTVYLVRQKKQFVITLVPAIFMTIVCSTFLLSEQIFSLDLQYALIIAAVTCVVSIIWFCLWYRKYQQSQK